MLQFQRIQSTPVIAKGASYNGVQADALAAPSATFDGTHWVMTVSIWNVAASAWRQVFFTSTDLATWTYVANSMTTVQTFINGSISWFAGKYWFIGGLGTLTVQHSTDLLTWTSVGTPFTNMQDDPGLTISPISSKLECWAIKDSTRDIWFSDSSDGSSWSAEQNMLPSANWNSLTNGEPQVWYSHGVRYITHDASVDSLNNGRSVAMQWSPGLNTSWITYGGVLGADYTYSWEQSQVFDGCCIGPYDRSDGRGVQLWMLYAGGDNFSTTNNTDSSIGLVFMNDPQSGKMPPPRTPRNISYLRR